MNRQTRDVGRLNVAILAKEGNAFRKVGWITTRPGGVQFGIARATGMGTKYSYRSDGSLYRVALVQTPGGLRETQQLIAKHRSLLEFRGLQQIFAAEVGAGDRLRAFPFRRSHDSIAVKASEGKVSFNLGLLEPNAPQALDGLERGGKVHFRLITKSVPWIVFWNRAGFETSVRPRS